MSTKPNDHKTYDDYIAHQSEKTLDPVRREKWLNEEWQQKIDGFLGVFGRLSPLLTPEKKVLCVGARTGQEVVALKEMGLEDVVGIDIVPHEEHGVIEGDMHKMPFEDETFDFVFTNIIDHSLEPTKFISEVERVLKVNGIFQLQMQCPHVNPDPYTEFVIENPFYDLLPLFKRSFCVDFGGFNNNFAGMNFEMVFQKDEMLNRLYTKHGTIETIEVPPEYQKVWDDINLPVQTRKLDTAAIFDSDRRARILSQLSKRAYFLTCLAEEAGCKRFAEVGTAQGYQFFTFAEYASKHEDASVISCDITDVRDSTYVKKHWTNDRIKFVNGNSANMAAEIKSSGQSCDFYYIDGAHDENAVLYDAAQLVPTQANDVHPVWVFDDFDQRFGCAKDILTLAAASKRFAVYSVGETASGQPTHQLIAYTKFVVQ